MSTDEQDQILGRLVREKKEREHLIAVLEAKMFTWAEPLGRIAEMCGAKGYVFGGQRSPVDGVSVEWLESLDFPGKSEIIETVRELEEERRKLRLITGHIEALS